MVDFSLNYCKYLINTLPFYFCSMVECGRVGQFLAVFRQSSCETFFVIYFLHGRPKTPLIV